MANKFVKPTSVNTYQELRATAKLNKQEKIVLQAFINMDKVSTRNEVKQKQLPDWENSTISGRVRGLLDKGFLEVVGKRQDEFSERTAEILMVQQPSDREAVTDKSSENLEPGDPIFG